MLEPNFYFVVLYLAAAGFLGVYAREQYDQGDARIFWLVAFVLSVPLLVKLLVAVLDKKRRPGKE